MIPPDTLPQTPLRQTAQYDIDGKIFGAAGTWVMKGSGIITLRIFDPREWIGRIAIPGAAAAILSILYDDPDLKFIIKFDLDINGVDFDEASAIVEDVPPDKPFQGPTIPMNIRTNPGELLFDLYY